MCEPMDTLYIICTLKRMHRVHYVHTENGTRFASIAVLLKHKSMMKMDDAVIQNYYFKWRLMLKNA